MTLYVRVVKNRDGGFRLQLTDGLNRTRALMQSAREDQASDSRHTADRMFGKLDWRTPDTGLDFVVSVAVIEAGKGLW